MGEKVIIPHTMVEREIGFSAAERRRLERMLSSSQSPERRRKKLTLYREADPETERRFSQTQLNPDTGSILLDQIGELYVLIWHEAKIGPEHHIYSPTQLGRDYFLNPPKTKTLMRLVPHRFPLGIDVTLRGVEEVRDKYRVDEVERGKEADQMLAALGRSHELLLARSRMREFSPQDLIDLLIENREFLEEVGLANPRNPQKRRINSHLSKGFFDSKGRKSTIAAYSRTFAMEYAIRQQLERVFPPVLVKFASIAEALAFERDLTRYRLERAVETIDDVIANPQERTLYAIWKLEGVALNLLRNIRVRPYVAKARRAAINLGIRHIDSDEDWESYRMKRRARGIPTAADLLREDNFEGAVEVLTRTKNMLTKVLETYSDYKTVKKEYHREHPQR